MELSLARTSDCKLKKEWKFDENIEGARAGRAFFCDANGGNQWTLFQEPQHGFKSRKSETAWNQWCGFALARWLYTAQNTETNLKRERGCFAGFINTLADASSSFPCDPTGYLRVVLVFRAAARRAETRQTLLQYSCGGEKKVLSLAGLTQSSE